MSGSPSSARLEQALSKPDELPQPSSRALPRRLRHFTTATQINFSDDDNNERAVMELITGDQPGLLAQVGYTFARLGVRVQNAKIATIGERAEDVFFITDHDNARPDERLREALRSALLELLDDEANLMARADGV